MLGCDSPKAGRLRCLTRPIHHLDRYGPAGRQPRGLIITRERKGFGLARNMGLGLAGAIVGGLLFRLLGFLPGLDQISILLRDVVAAFVGSLIVLAAIGLWQRFHKSQ